jgi:hypothetical protein
VGQLFKNWMPHFVARARVTEPGSAPKGGRWWECEMSASTADFELAGPNRAGDQWRMMLGFNHMPIWVQARVPNNTGYFDPSGYCLGTLVENTPAVQVLMESLPGPCDGTATVTFRAFNPTNQPVELKLLAQYSGASADILKEEPTLKVEAGKSAEFSLNRALPPEVKGGRIFYSVESAGKLLFRYFTYFQVGYPEYFMAHTPPKGTFPLDAGFNPVRLNVMIQGDAYYLDNPDAAVSLDYRITREGESKPVAEGSVDHPTTYYFRRLVRLPPAKSGTYKLVATLKTKDGKTLGPESRTFEKLDETKAFAEWWDTKLGSVERVIPPFEPMAVKGAAVTMWGRSYELGALGLPARVVSQGEAVLASPARVVVVAGGKEAVLDLKAAPRLTESKPWRVAYQGQAEAGGVRFSAKGTVEQDGLVYVELTYAPAARQGVTLDALRLEFPIADAQADCLLCIGPGGNYSSRATMVLPRDKQGQLWSTLETGRLGSGMTIGSFYPCVWVGSERRGLLWWADSDRGWAPDNDVPAHEVLRKGNEVIIRNNIIGKPLKLDAPRTIAFGYMASPFRPLVKNWRTAIMSTDGTFSGGESWGYKWRKDPKTGKVFEGWNLLTPPSADPAEWSQIWAEYKKKADDKVKAEQPFDPCGARNWMFVHTSIPLVGYGWKSPDDRVVGYFAPEWGDGECYTKSNQDYYLYLADRAFREGGLRTIYWDIFFPTQHGTIQNDVAYELPDGRIQHGYAGFNTRRFLMRMYALMGDHGLTPGSQVTHATNAYLLVACPWVDAILDGEYHKLTDESTMDWVDGYSIERMRPMSCPHNFGTVISWMTHIQIGDKERHARVRRGFNDYIRLYDTWRGAEHYMPQQVLDWGILSADYVPFWRNQFVQCDDKDILVSMWRQPDRVMLVVFNYNGKQGKDARLKVDLDALGLAPKLPWQEFVRVSDLVKGDGEPASRLDFYGRTVEVPALAPHTGRIISIRRY